MNRPLTLAISPCPNDTYIFDAWVNSRLGPGAPAVSCRLEDIATLNDLAFQHEPDVVKVSFYAYSRLRDTYCLLHAGAAIGRGCGPLVVAKKPSLNLAHPAGLRIAVPGQWTTANLLFSLYQPKATNKLYIPFDDIMPALAAGEVDAGVIIHEGRFTYGHYGLSLIEDLGAWWEAATGHPLPLGAIIAKKELGPEALKTIEETIRASIRHARANPEAPRGFMREHAAEMDEAVMASHVDLYVNDYSLDFGLEGRAAIDHLLELAEAKGLL